MRCRIEDGPFGLSRIDLYSAPANRAAPLCAEL